MADVTLDSTAVRFWSKVTKTKDCWLWNAAALPRGYGRFWWRGKVRYAHRVSLEMHGGTVPDDLCVLHSCDNPRCVNPSHLRVGDQTENMREASSKGRIVRKQDWRGERNPKSKLTSQEVEAIKASGERSRTLAGRYGVTITRIQQIRRAARLKAEEF